MPPRGHRGRGGFSTGARGDSRQHSLFGSETETPVPTGRFNIEVEWRAALKEAIDGSGLTREAIAAEMTRLLGGESGFRVGRSHLDAWTAPSRSPWKLPASWLPAFVQTTGAAWLHDRLARLNGRHVVDDETVRLAQLGRNEVEIGRLQGHSDTLKRSFGRAA